MTNVTPSARRSAAGAKLPTAEWCRARAVIFADAAASMLKGFEDDAKYAAALRIAARVLDESAFTNIYDILKDLTFTHTDETGDVSVVGIGHAAEAILAYLKGETS